VAQENHAHDIYDLFHSIHKTAVRKRSFFAWEEMIDIIEASHRASLRFVEKAAPQTEETWGDPETAETKKQARGRWFACAGARWVARVERSLCIIIELIEMSPWPARRSAHPGNLPQAPSQSWGQMCLSPTSGRSATSGNGSSPAIAGVQRIACRVVTARLSCVTHCVEW
jgi:hypothetical protein